ncbi:MAG: efflux RND transporter periplasmic adaptor subunit [Gemmatimonadetes bacterium]|nr:efflux RND transporter periplasmic adaptor subunit [Gemmatimonadota bacterium]
MNNSTTSRRAPRALPSLALAAALVSLAATAACSKGDADASLKTTGPVTTVGREAIAVVRTDTIESGPVVQGTLVPEREAKLRAQVGGSVLRTMVEQGERVGAGAVLAQIDDRTFRDAWLAARAQQTSAQMSADVAGRELARAQRLVKEGALAERDLENATRADLAARAALDDAKSRYANAEEGASRTRITAPFGGVVSERQVSAGDVVAPGAAMFTVIDPSSMRLEAAVPAEQLGQVRIGATVKFVVNGYGGRQFVGRVNRINPSADPVTRQVRIYATIPNAGAGGAPLVGGLFAEGRVASASRLGLLVPAVAVDQRGLTPQVVRLRNGVVERVGVELGLHDKVAETYEVRAGLSAGDTLLVGAAQGISAGTAVRVSDPGDTRKSGRQAN